MEQLRTYRRCSTGCWLILAWLAAALLVGGQFRPALAAPRPLPDTTSGIHVFNDQLSELTPGRIAFSATHYDGTQKMTRADADALRAANPNFVILHYRLGLGLGYRAATGSCSPTGTYISIIDNTWVQEWPGDASVTESWFYHTSGSRVFGCSWGWYLVELDDSAWRTWWTDRVLTQLAHNDDDGLFADSFSVPNYLGADTFSPALPAYDPTFESQWVGRLERFITYVQGRFAGNYYFIPNVGSWVTSRDATNYSGADGVMLEGFGYDALAAFGATDWALQLNRALGLIGLGRAVIGQSYEVGSVSQRLFTLGSYLLIKGNRTYVNLDTGLVPEWWPEYQIPIGAPTNPPPANVADLFDATRGVYVRAYTNGLVLVNPSDQDRLVPLGATYYRAQPSGGGDVPTDGVIPAAWTVAYTAVSSVTVSAASAVILVLNPSGVPPTATSTPIPSATPTHTPTISPTVATNATSQGQVRYRGSGDAVPGVVFTAAGPGTTSASSDGAGMFSVPMTTGENWVVTPKKDGDFRGSISAIDAVYILQYAVGLRSLDDRQRLAGDTNGDGRITAYDASLILQFAVGLIPRLTVAARCGSDWAFVPVPAAAGGQRVITPLNTADSCRPGAIAYEPLSGNPSGQDFEAVLYGECSGNWTGQPTATPASSASATPVPSLTPTLTPTLGQTPTRSPTPVGTAGASVVTERWGAHVTAVHTGAAADVALDAAHPTWGGSNGGSMVLGETPGSQWWSLLRFDVSALPSGTFVRSARLRLAVFADSEPHDVWVAARVITDPDLRGAWSEADATFAQRRPGVDWSSAGDLNTSLGGEAGRSYLGNLPQWATTWVEWDVTTAVRQWVSSPSTNQGLALWSGTGTLFEPAARENADSTIRPYLEITYEGPNPSRPAQVTGVNVIHRSGQSFVTWQEQAAGASDVRYRVYRHNQPVRAASLDGATLLAEVQPGSGAYVHETSGCSNGSNCSPIGQERFVIEDGGTALATGVGLFVNTTHGGGTVSYAVTRVVDGNENRDDFVTNFVDGVVETEATPRPVRVWTNATGTGWVYTQFMDYANWNPKVEGYAYNFYVGVPAGYTPTGAAVPLLMQLHAYTGTYRLPADPGAGGTDYQWPVIQVSPDDRTNTWWFGFGANAGHVDRRLGDAPVVDYAHQRLDAILQFVAGEFHVDANRQYLFGGSMGGSGTVNYGLRRGNVFAAIYAESAMTNFARAGAAGGAAWETGGITALWGTTQQNLTTNLGMGIWDWYDLQTWASTHPAAQLPFLADHHGRADDIIDWETQGAPWYPALEAGRHGVVGVFDASGHTWPGFVADSSVFSLTAFSFRRDESFPAFTSAANSDDPAAGGSGCRNCRLEWSSSWLNFAGPPVDTPTRYEVAVRTTTGSSTTVDVTLRRLQHFVVTVGASYNWEHRRLADNVRLGGGVVTAGADGLLTVPGLPVAAGGTRLVVEPAGS